jgi:hypothetical protein
MSVDILCSNHALWMDDDALGEAAILPFYLYLVYLRLRVCLFQWAGTFASSGNAFDEILFLRLTVRLAGHTASDLQFSFWIGIYWRLLTAC